LTCRALTACDVLRVSRESTQASKLAHRDEAAAPVGGLAERQTLVDRQPPQRFSGAQLRVLDRPVAFTERGQHLNRQTLEPTFPVGPLFAQYRLGI
jgi:hypothetical protein